MQLTRHTDYALRLLIHLACNGNQRTPVAVIARDQQLSRTHLLKIANDLSNAGLLDAQRGRGGGVCLARPPEKIVLGEVIRITEPHCELVDCSGCRLRRDCTLPGVLDQAMAAFMAVFARHTLADAIRPGRIMAPARAA